MKFYILITTIIIFLSGCASQTQYTSSNDPLYISIQDTDYIHRWSTGTQHEFTPEGQEDLSRWQDMVTINVYPEVKDGESLANIANQILSTYQSVGRILRTNSIPRTKKEEAEHLIVAILGNSKLLEAVFARVKMVDGKGTAIVWSHRMYGASSGNAMSKWLKENGPTREQYLMAIENIKVPK